MEWPCNSARESPFGQVWWFQDDDIAMLLKGFYLRSPKRGNYVCFPPKEVKDSTLSYPNHWTDAHNRNQQFLIRKKFMNKIQLERFWFQKRFDEMNNVHMLAGTTLWLFFMTLSTSFIWYSEVFCQPCSLRTWRTSSHIRLMYSGWLQRSMSICVNRFEVVCNATIERPSWTSIGLYGFPERLHAFTPQRRWAFYLRLFELMLRLLICRSGWINVSLQAGLRKKTFVDSIFSPFLSFSF